MTSSQNQLLPIIPLRDLVVFPRTIVPLVLTRQRSLAALDRAAENGNLVLLVAQKAAEVDQPQPRDLFRVGTVGEIVQVLRLPETETKVLLEGKQVVRIQQCYEREKYLEGLVSPLAVRTESSKEIEALARAVLRQFETYARLSDNVPDEIYARIRGLEDPLEVAHAVAGYTELRTADKQGVLSATSVRRKLLLLSKLLSKENELLELEEKILSQVKSQISRSQKEYFLSEQMRAIEKELGWESDEANEIEDLRNRLAKTPLSEEARSKIERELARLARMQRFSPEATVTRSFVEWILDLPWGKKTRDRIDLERAKKILDADHFGLTKAKERILEYLAVRRLVDSMKGPILCFVGPPGVGKTSLARSIARALGRRFVRMSLGGVRDEAEIRGHRRTYVGALPGKIAQALKKAGSMNPVFLLDEVDKMSVDFRGDPSAALLEVLDPEQNRVFNDHYLEIDLDLSNVLFITTANTTEGIPAALLDRMEVIELPGYTEDEKRSIAEQFLVPKQVKAHGLTRRNIRFSPEAIDLIIQGYTREAGVRQLERQIATVCRRVVKDMVAKGKRWCEEVTPRRVRELLGPKRYDTLRAEKKPEVGLATGLAWTEAGGELLPTETTVMPGKGDLLLTGSLGEIMQESAKAALSYIRSHARQLAIKGDFYKSVDIHVHIPEGAIPKDGPSAGVAMATSLVSALSGVPVRQEVAMTGEITLRGKILRVGGLKEKILAAHRAGIATVILPRSNRDDLREISEKVRRKMRFVFVETLDQVLDNALLTESGRKAPRKRPAAAIASAGAASGRSR